IFISITFNEKCHITQCTEYNKFRVQYNKQLFTLIVDNGCKHFPRFQRSIQRQHLSYLKESMKSTKSGDNKNFMTSFARIHNQNDCGQYENKQINQSCWSCKISSFAFKSTILLLT